MINKFKALDNIGLVSYLSKLILAIRKFFATKSEMDVVATALTDLDRRIDKSIQTISVGDVTTGDPGTEAKVTNVGTNKDIVLNFSIPRGADGYNGNDGVTPTISIGSVTTVDAIKDAEVTNSGTYPDVVLDFKIPRGKQGPQGDMSEKDDNGYTNADVTKVDYCEIRKIWQIPFDTNVDFADKLKVPIPSLDMIQSMVDCIKMIHDVSLSINFDNFQTVKPLYTWGQLHWSLQCSNKNSGIVYVTKYGTNRNQSSFNIDKSGSITRSSTIIEIVVRYESNNTGNPYCVQVTVENEYGRAYYIGFTIGQEIVIK